MLLRNSLVMFSVHATSQWILIEYFTQMYSFQALMYLAFVALATHVLVVLERYRTCALGLQYDEVLQSRQNLLRLRLTSRTNVIALAVLQAAAIGTIVAKVMAGSTKHLLAQLCFLALMVVHIKALHDTSVVRQKWREPQLARKEVYTAALETMPSTSVRPSSLSSQRAKKLLLVWHVTKAIIVVALMLVARITLDVLQLRGELLGYSVSRGKLIYPAGSQAFHNTMLLDQNADSFTLQLNLGDFTHGVWIQLVHPLLAEEDKEYGSFFWNSSDELQFSLPSGPLYSQLTLKAVGDYVSTTYVIHILRLGKAISLDLSCGFNETQYPELAGAVFQQERHLQYQFQHRLWYVPDIDLSANPTMLVKMTSLVFAPIISGYQEGVKPKALGICKEF